MKMIIGIFMSYLYYLFFISIFIFIMINHTISVNSKKITFWHIFNKMFRYFWIITWMKKANIFQMSKVQSQGATWYLLDFLSILAWCCL